MSRNESGTSTRGEEGGVEREGVWLVLLLRLVVVVVVGVVVLLVPKHAEGGMMQS